MKNLLMVVFTLFISCSSPNESELFTNVSIEFISYKPNFDKTGIITLIVSGSTDKQYTISLWTQSTSQMKTDFFLPNFGKTSPIKIIFLTSNNPDVVHVTAKNDLQMPLENESYFSYQYQ